MLHSKEVLLAAGPSWRTFQCYCDCLMELCWWTGLRGLVWCSVTASSISSKAVPTRWGGSRIERANYRTLDLESKGKVKGRLASLENSLHRQEMPCHCRSRFGVRYSTFLTVKKKMNSEVFIDIRASFGLQKNLPSRLPPFVTTTMRPHVFPPGHASISTCQQGERGKKRRC